MRSASPRPPTFDAAPGGRTGSGRLHRSRFTNRAVGRLVRRVVMVVLLLAGAGTTTVWATQSSGAVVTEPAQRLDPTRDSVRALLISDSTWLSLRNFGAVDAVQGFPNELALAKCRRRVERSCSTPAGTPPSLLDELVARGNTSGWNTLIVQTGYNDSDTNFKRDFRLIVDTARQLGYTRIVWLTLRLPENNRTLAQAYLNSNIYLNELVASGEFPDVTVGDWANYSADEPTWVSGDRIHYTKYGAWAAADYISRKIAAINGLACAQPLRAGDDPARPCQDPDQLTSKPDFGSLYPMTVPYFVATYSWTGRSSWPNAPWWLR